MNSKRPFSINSKPEMTEASIIVGWKDNAAGLGSATIDYLNKKLGGREFAEIDPEIFFVLNGVVVDKDVAQFPVCKFYSCPEKNLIFVKTAAPQMEWFTFLNSILDVVETVCPIKELYTVGGMVSLSAHTFPRPIVATANSDTMKMTLDEVGLSGSMNYETPPGQRPTLSSYLIWVAKKRNIKGACIWIPVPFYLVSVRDVSAVKQAVSFLNKRFELSLNIDDLLVDSDEQSRQIDDVMQRYPELSDLIKRLENNLSVTEEESNMLTEIIENNLGKIGHN